MNKLSNYLALSLLFLFFAGCQSPDYSKWADGKVIPVDNTQSESIDPLIDSIISTYRIPLQSQMEEVIAFSSQHMRKGTPEDLLNNFVSDLIFMEGSAIYEAEDGQPIDICLLNYGGLRTSIPEGPVTQARIFELMPFENEMVVVTLSPEKTWDMFGYIASRSVGVPVSGIRLAIKNGQVDHVLIQGKPFDNTRNYKILTSDYLADSGDSMRFFSEPIKTEVLGLRIRDAIILHLKKQHAEGNMISSALDGRVYYVK